MTEESELKINHHKFFHQINEIEQDKRCEKFPDIFSTLPLESQRKIQSCCEKSGDFSERRNYLQAILFVLKSLQENVLSQSETFMSIKECRAVRIIITDAVSIGIIPNIQSKLMIGSEKNYPLSISAKQEILSEMVKYNRLKTTIEVLTDCYEEIALKPAMMDQVGPLLAGLLQLAHAPLMKPLKSKDIDPTKFNMTEDLYIELIHDQSEFTKKLDTFIRNSQLCLIMRELMVLFGSQKTPNWLKKIVKKYLVDAIMEPTGVFSLMVAACNDSLDSRTNWEQITKIAKIVAIKDDENIEKNKYYESICSQLLTLLGSKDVKDSVSIANICIKNLYEIQPDVCQQLIINVIVGPLMTKIKTSKSDLVLQSESTISECIEKMIRCFSPEELNPIFKGLPPKLMKHISFPLLYMYIKTMNSASFLKPQVEKLLLILFKDDNICHDLFQAIWESSCESSEEFGEKHSFRFGPSGGLEIVSMKGEYEHEEVANGLYNLVIEHSDLSRKLCKYLLRFYTTHEAMAPTFDPSEMLSTNHTILMKKTAIELLIKLSNDTECQKAQINDLESTLEFVESLVKGMKEKDSYKNENNIQTVYVGLMLIKTIIEEKKLDDWSVFEPLAVLLSMIKKEGEVVEPLSTLINELLDTITKRKKKPTVECFRDMNINDSSNFNNAMKDLSDPLIPVRAHGLMELTKLIASSDPIAIAKKDLLLYLFQLNLKDDDSFIYLTAINGLCVMALKFPEELIGTLVQAFIDLPDRNETGEIAPENRVKIGQVLVQVTSELGEMAYKYRNILINGFLCGARDPLPMVRASSLSCLGEVCKTLGFRLGSAITEILFCLTCIIETDKALEARRAAVLVTTLLIRGLEKHILTELGNDLTPLYRALKYLRDNDRDDVLRSHAQLALEEIDDIVQSLLFSEQARTKKIFLLP